MTLRSLLVRSGIVGCAAGLFLFGLLIQTSISDAMDVDWVGRQVGWAVIAVAAGAVVACVPTDWWLRRAWVGYLATLGLLALVPVIGVTRNNSKRWLELGVSIQPSELMKIAFIIAMARLLRWRRRDARAASLLLPGLLFAVPALLIFAQPDLGSALLFVPVALAMLFLSGLPGRQMATILAGGVASGAIGYAFFLQPYQRSRVLSTFQRDSLPLSERMLEGYQLEQSLRSIGIGGLDGQGLGAGLQNQMNALPYRHNDFVFAVVAEETGFIGAALLLALLVGLTWFVLRAALGTRDPGARLICVGVGTLLATQGLIHVGVNLGVVPTTGMTLPFVSAGGSSLVTYALALGLVVAVAGRRPIVFFGELAREQMQRLPAR